MKILFVLMLVLILLSTVAAGCEDSNVDDVDVDAIYNNSIMRRDQAIATDDAFRDQVLENYKFSSGGGQ